ncbi:MAG TPA: hypothetical protein VHT91_43615 [Kofleriaceae bacterium]|jgi:hypothetical protein|nr:hypothetical protein [Kofleriaceae bacterium]
MVSGFIGARLGVSLARWVFVLGSIGVLGGGVAGCEPLYGGKPEKLTTPVRKKPPKEEPIVEAPVKMVDECTADFQADPRTARPQSNVSSELTDQGTTAIANSDKASDPTAQAGLIREGIDKFRNALIKDPYNAAATLKLALAYDKVYRKGCALAMLKRLAKLATNPKFSRTANAEIDSIGDNNLWFRHYRKDAMTAVGR